MKPGYGQWSRREQIDGVGVERMRHYVPTRPTACGALLSEISFGTRLPLRALGRSDAIVAVSPALISTAMAAARARVFHRRRPLVVWVQDLYTLGLAETGQGGRFVGRSMGFLEGWLLRRADVVVVIHERFAERVTHDFGIPRERVVVVRNWTHLRPFPDVDIAAARRALGWGDETVVLHAGNMGVKQGSTTSWMRHKGRRSAARTSASCSSAMAATGERLESLGEGIDTLQFLRPLDDEGFVNALAAADVLLVNEKPGVAEMAVPSKLTSYFSAGRPVLAATDSTGITAAELARADAGVVVPAAEPDALLDAALALAADPGARADPRRERAQLPEYGARRIRRGGCVR